MLAQRSDNHHTVYKVRRCFLWQQTYFQLDIYKQPCNSRCIGLVILETYTTLSPEELSLPPFLSIVREVTSDTEFSMYNLSSMGCPGDATGFNGHHHHHHHHKFGNGCTGGFNGNGRGGRKSSAGALKAAQLEAQLDSKDFALNGNGTMAFEEEVVGDEDEK